MRCCAPASGISATKHSSRYNSGHGAGGAWGTSMSFPCVARSRDQILSIPRNPSAARERTRSTRMNPIRTLFALILALAAGSAAATEINVTDVQGAPGEPAVVTISLANSAGATFITGQLNYPAFVTTNLVATSLQPGVVTCSVLMPGTIQFQANPFARPGDAPAAPD